MFHCVYTRPKNIETVQILRLPSFHNTTKFNFERLFWSICPSYRVRIHTHDDVCKYLIKIANVIDGGERLSQILLLSIIF